MSAIEGKKIAIVGGGPGGLTLARLLQMRGADIAVYERDQSREARVQGSALDLHEDSGLAALEAAGLMDAFWANHRADLDRLRLTDLNGTVLHDHARKMEGAGKRPEIERGPLRELLLDSLRPDTVQWGCKLESAEMSGDKVALHFAGRDSIVADIAIGCDGANSRLRALVTPIRPEYVGVTLVEGVVPTAKDAVPELWDLVGGAALIALGNERTLGMGTKPDGSILFYAGLKTNDPDGRQLLEDAGIAEERVAWFHANFEGWSELWTPLMEKAVSNGVASAAGLPARSAVGSKSECDADRRCGTRHAAVCRGRREHGDARCAGAVAGAPERSGCCRRDCCLRGRDVRPHAAHDGRHDDEYRDVLRAGCSGARCGTVSKF